MKKLDGNKPILFLGDNHGNWSDLLIKIKNEFQNFKRQ